MPTPYDDQGGFVVLQDPGGNEMCVFPGDAGGAIARPFALCVDSAEPVEAARWWHGVLGGRIGDGPDGTPRYVHDAAGLDGIVLKFVPVDDERVVKNRCHWDVTTDDVDELVARGATVVRARGDGIDWTVLADPQGNEFCAFGRALSRSSASVRVRPVRREHGVDGGEVLGGQRPVHR